MENTEAIVESIEGSIKIVRYNRPKKKNAIDANMYIRLTKILNDAANDSDITLVVLTGTGDYYSSGNDVVAKYKDVSFSPLDVLRDFIEAFIRFPKILVAIVNGPAIGIAATTLGLVDLVFASENAFFYTPFTRIGIVAEGCSTVTFPRLLGDRKATEMLLFCHKMSAKEAFEYGFVNYLYKPEEIQSMVWDKIEELSQFPQHALILTRNLIKRTIIDQLLKANEMEINELRKLMTFEPTNIPVKPINKL